MIEVKLSRTGSRFTLRKSCSTASKKVSSAISRCGGGLQVLFGRNGLGLAWVGCLGELKVYVAWKRKMLHDVIGGH